MHYSRSSSATSLVVTLHLNHFLSANLSQTFLKKPEHRRRFRAGHLHAESLPAAWYVSNLVGEGKVWCCPRLHINGHCKIIFESDESCRFMSQFVNDSLPRLVAQFTLPYFNKTLQKKYAGKRSDGEKFTCAENAIKKKRSKKSVSAFTLLPVISFLFLPTSGGVLTTTPLYTQPRTPQCQKRWRSRREIFPFFFFLRTSASAAKERLLNKKP